MYQINSKSSLKAALLLGAATATAISLSAPAAADTPVETVVVTGSLIPTPNATSNSPIQTLGTEQIDLSGHANIEAVLNTMPQINPGFGQSSNNPGAGISTVDLRGLTPIRTLVLVDGMRAMPTTVSGVVDVSQIPSALVDHVDVVTGGGSATYGSDAIAGVVNFVLKQDFQGMQSQVRWGEDVENSFAPTTDINITMGMNSSDGKANITIFGEFYKRAGVLQGADPNYAIDDFTGSGTTPDGVVAASQGFPTIASSGCGGHTSGHGKYSFQTNGNPVEFCNKLPTSSGNAADVAQASKFETLEPGGNRYSFAGVNELITPDTRHEFAGFGHYDIFPDVTAYAQFQYVNTVNPIQLAPTPITPGAALNFVVTPSPLGAACTGGTVPGNGIAGCDANLGDTGFTSFITPAFQTEINARAVTTNPATGKPYGYTPFAVDWRSAAVGPRLDIFTNNVYSGTFGLKGGLPWFNGWDWNAWYMQGGASQDSLAYNNVLASHLGQAMLSCPTGSGKGCVPVDIFGAGNLTPAMASFIGARTDDLVNYNREMTHFETHGNIGDFWGAGPITTAFGFEWREDGGQFIPDQAKQNFDILGFNPSKATNGRYNVWELFNETRIPILTNMPFVEELSLDGGFRWSRYSGAGDLETWKGGVDYQPIDDIRFRAMWQRAARAPNINELFNGGADGFPATTDPCATTLANGKPNPNPGSATACQNQFHASGLTYTGTFTQVNAQEEATLFGNPSLKPETSNTMTLGAVITPTFLPGVTASVDYWHIAVKNFIGSAFGGAQAIINQCITADNGTGTRAFKLGEPTFGNACDLVTRNADGSLLFSIPNENVNLSSALDPSGELSTGGIDLQISAQHDVADLLGQSGDWGAVDLNLAVEFLTEYVDPGRAQCAVSNGSTDASLRGQVDSSNSCGIAVTAGSQVRPNYRWTNRFGYTFDDWRVMLTWTRIGAVVDNFGTGNHIGDYDMFDLAVRWNITDQYAADIIVNNLFNKTAPLGGYSADGGINTLNNTYDVLGTEVYLGLTAKL